MNQLEVLRESLGQCDEIILDALLMRNRIVEDIMVYKEANNVPILQPEQEAKQKEWLERRMQEKRHKNEVADVFESITRNSKKIQARKLFNYNIVLIGFMGAGKSTISDYLKTVFAMDIIEMDQIIAERAGMSISDIFETYGEQYFRDCETNLLIEMQSRTNVVISCGGGTPMRECNVAEIAFLCTMGMRAQLKSVRTQDSAVDYVRQGSMALTRSNDIFLYHTVTKTAKPKDSDSSSGGSDSDHGGTGGSF